MVNVTSRPPYSVLVIDNSDNVLRSLSSLPAEHPDVVYSIRLASSFDDPRLLDGDPVDVTVLDLMLGRDDEQTISHIPDLVRWGTQVLLYTNVERPYPLRQALKAGIAGLSLKHDGREKLVTCIREVGMGEFVMSSPLAGSLLHDKNRMVELTDSEIEVLRGFALGLTAAEVAQTRGVKESTISTQIENIRWKYDAVGRGVPQRHRESKRQTSVNIVRATREGFIDGYHDHEDPPER